MNSNYPNIKQSIIMLVFITLLMLLLGFIMGIVILIFDLQHLEKLFVGLGNLIAIGIFIIRAKEKSKCSYRSLYPMESFDFIFLFAIVTIAIGSSVIFSEMDNILRIFLPMPEFFKDILLVQNANIKSLFGTIFLYSIVAPVTEELLFRGLILQSFLNQYSRKKSVIASSLLFACFHLNPWQFLGAFVLGILFSFWFIKHRSLLPCLIGHSIYNSIPWIFSDLLHINIEGYTTVNLENTFQPLWFNLAGVSLIIIGLLVSNQLSKKDNSLVSISRTESK